MSSRLVDILRQIPPAGSAGFEGLIAQLLEALTGRRFSLALSGSQAGRDMSSREPSANMIAVECKRYGQRSELNERELLGELVQVVESIPDLDVWVLVASREVSSQLAEVLRRSAGQFGVEFLSLSSGDGSPSSLEVLCALSPESVIAHSGIQAIAQAEETRALLHKIAQHPQLQQRAAALRSAFSSPLVGYENWRVEQNRWFSNCVTSESETRANFSQPINVDDNRVRLINRAAASAALDGWLQGWKDAHTVFTVLGDEGDGKTWSVTSWLSQRLKTINDFPAVVFYSSTNVVDNDPLPLLSDLISHRLPQVQKEQSPRRMRRWISRPRSDMPLLLLILDGINERRSYDWWRTLLERLAGQDWYNHIAVVVTCRTSYWQRYFSPIRHLLISSFAISPYDDIELNTALAHYNLGRGDIPSTILPIIRKPRYFDLMVKFRERLAESGDITVTRLIYEDWRDRLQRKQDIVLSDEEFQGIICRLAATHQGRSHLFSEQDITNVLPTYSDRSRILEELRTGGVLQSRNRGTAYQVNEQLLVYGLGLLLVDQLESVSGGEDFREVIAGWLEPHAEMDIKAAICEFAALHALGLNDVRRDAKVALLQAWIDSRNPQQETESNLVAYLPLDPQSYVELAEAIWSDAHDNAWAQELLIHAFLDKYALPHVASALPAAFERWLGFVHIHGSPFTRETEEDVERAQQAISQRIGTKLQPGTFPFANYQFTAIQDDGQLRLGRAALAVISYLPRNEFIHAIAMGCVAEAIMGRPDKYNLFAWVIRTSPQPIWPDIQREVEHLLSVDSSVTQQAAYRLLSFNGSEEAFHLQTTIPQNIFPPSPLAERYQQDPCTSGFSWTAEDCVRCLQRQELPADHVARQITGYCVDPNLPVPDSFKSQFSALPETIDIHSLWIALISTEADHTLEAYEPALAAYAPKAIADLIRLTARQISDRQDMPRRQLSIHLKQYYLVLTADEKKAINHTWEQLIATYETWGEAEKTAELFLFKLVLRNVDATAQLSYLLRRPEDAGDWVDYEQAFLPTTHWREIREQLHKAVTATEIARYLWFISANPKTIPPDVLNTWVVPLINHESSSVRMLVLKIIYKAREIVSIESIVQGGWRWSSTYKEIENHWGSLLLCEHGNKISFEELCRRTHPIYLGYAVKCRGEQPEEIQVFAESIHQVWLRLGRDIPNLAPDMPNITIDASVSGDIQRVSRRGLPKDISSHSVTYLSPHASWGGEGDDEQDIDAWDLNSFGKRQQTLVQIIREAVAQQEAAGNIWFGKDFHTDELDKIVELYPELVSQWIGIALSDEPEAIRAVRLSSSFYMALCITLLAKDVDRGVTLYLRLQEIGTRVYVIDYLSGLGLLDHALFNASPSSSVCEAWKRNLEECAADYGLMKVVLLAESGTGKDWLWSYVTERVQSSVPIDRARSLVLLAFFNSQEAGELLRNLLQCEPDTWLRKLVKSSVTRWERNTWARHWFRRFLTTDDDVIAWASFRLFLRCVDSRFWFWKGTLEAEVGKNNLDPLRKAFLQDNIEVIQGEIRDNEKDLKEHFLGQEVLKRQAWPWMDFSS